MTPVMTLAPLFSVAGFSAPGCRPSGLLSGLLSVAAQAGTGAPVAAPEVLPPLLILVLCVAAGLGTVMLLPGRRREASVRRLGGLVVLAAFLILAALLVRYAAAHSPSGVHYYFWIFSVIALFGAVRVVTHPRPVYSALYFVLTVFASAGLFVLLWAEFMAAALVLIYAGAILITYVFVIMLAAQSVPSEKGPGGRRGAWRPSPSTTRSAASRSWRRPSGSP